MKTFLALPTSPALQALTLAALLTLFSSHALADSLPCECEEHGHAAPRPEAAGFLAPLPTPPRDSDGIPSNSTAVTRLDLIAFYNDQARTSLGGAANDPSDASAIREKIIASVAITNTAFTNSNLPVELVLLAIEPVDYQHPVEEGFNVPLDHLETAGDGQLDQLLERQQFFGADLVTLYLDSNRSGGKANVHTPSTTLLPYSVVRAKNPALTLSHEIGHNLGCRHRLSTYASRPSAWFEDAFASLFTGTDGERYGTVMVSTGSLNRDGAERVPIFSSPDLQWQGTTTGNDAADSARAIRASATVLANFRQKRQLAEVDILRTPAGPFLSLVGAIPDRRFTLQRSLDARAWIDVPDSERRANSAGFNTTMIRDAALPADAPRAFYRWRMLVE